MSEIKWKKARHGDGVFLAENEISVAVFESEDEALNFLAAQGFDVDTETQIVPVTVSGRMK